MFRTMAHMHGTNWPTRSGRQIFAMVAKEKLVAVAKAGFVSVDFRHA